MAEAILLVLWVGTCLFFVCRDIKAKGDRDRHEWWLSELKDCLHSIEKEFSRRCFEITEKTFSEYNERLDKLPSICTDFAWKWQIDALFDIIHKHNDSITDLKKEYISNLYNKVVEQKHITLNTIPDHLIREYETNISKIADTYNDFGNLMWHHLLEIKQRRKK